MIKITEINPLGAKPTTVEAIKAEFLAQTKKDYDPYHELTKWLMYGRLRRAQKKFVGYLFVHYDDLITGTPDRLAHHMSQLNNELVGKMVGGKFRTTKFGDKLYELFGYERHFRSAAKKGLWLARRLNIKTCPYCNSQYTLYVEKDQGGQAKFQFDHFFSKRKYPYLSISLYNLIPSCGPCNGNKSDKPFELSTHYHPYNCSIADLAVFRAEVPVDLEKLTTGDVKGLEITITFKAKFTDDEAFVTTHDKLFDISDSYGRHVDIAQDLLYKAIAYNSARKEDLMNIKGLFGDDESLYYRYLIGNYALTEEILHRPLAKVTQDLARQFGLLPHLPPKKV